MSAKTLRAADAATAAFGVHGADAALRSCQPCNALWRWRKVVRLCRTAAAAGRIFRCQVLPGLNLLQPAGGLLDTQPSFCAEQSGVTGSSMVKCCRMILLPIWRRHIRNCRSLLETTLTHSAHPRIARQLFTLLIYSPCLFLDSCRIPACTFSPKAQP